MPALPLDEAGKYVAAAYIVFLALILLYVAIMATKLARVERDLAELNQAAAEREAALEPAVPTLATVGAPAAPVAGSASGEDGATGSGPPAAG